MNRILKDKTAPEIIFAALSELGYDPDAKKRSLNPKFKDIEEAIRALDEVYRDASLRQKRILLKRLQERSLDDYRRLCDIFPLTCKPSMIPNEERMQILRSGRERYLELWEEIYRASDHIGLKRGILRLMEPYALNLPSDFWEEMLARNVQEGKKKNLLARFALERVEKGRKSKKPRP
jgi:hypothetical protein